MKKIILFFLLLIFPFTVKAVNVVNYDITNIFQDAQILENGDLSVKEVIVLNGSFNGYERDLTYRNSKLINHNPIDFSEDAIYNGSSIKNVQIKAKKISKKDASFEMLKDEDYEALTRTFYKEDAVNKNYVESSIQDGMRYRMYYESSYETVAFYLEYTISDVIVKHKDVAELYWTFIGNDFEDDIENLEIHIHLPKQDNSDLFRVWGHGDITGEVNRYDNQEVIATLKKINAGTPIDVRVTWDANLLSNVKEKKSTTETALPQILEVEEIRAKEANEIRKQAKLMYNVTSVLCYIYIIIIIGWWIYVYLKHDREYKSEFTNQYNREFINDYNVEVVDVLMNKTVSENALSASILNLIYKKNISVEEKPSEKKKEKSYEFKLLNQNGLNNTEELLVHFLFEKVGKNNTFTTEDLKQYASSSTTYKGFHNSYEDWVQSVKSDAARQNFYEENGLPIITSIFFLLIAFFLNFLVLYFDANIFLSLIVLMLGVIFFVYALTIKKRTKSGNEDYVRWKAFKRFLNDFGNFEVKELPEIALWERYLVYATVFGLADKVEKSMNVKIQEMQLSNESFYTPSWIDYHIAYHVNQSITNSINANRTKYSSEVRSSSTSSGGGYGGGFSSGGGFGGGGGGGRGF